MPDGVINTPDPQIDGAANHSRVEIDRQGEIQVLNKDTMRLRKRMGVYPLTTHATSILSFRTFRKSNRETLTGEHRAAEAPFRHPGLFEIGRAISGFTERCVNSCTQAGGLVLD